MHRMAPAVADRLAQRGSPRNLSSPRAMGLRYSAATIGGVQRTRTREGTMRIFFSVGEPSGDLHGANLVRELRAAAPSIHCVGYGGPKMAAAGCELAADLTQRAVMGFVGVVEHLPALLDLCSRADRWFAKERPDAVIVIDYPGFNSWIAWRAKTRGIPVFWYGAPQHWAWAPWRVESLKANVDHLLCKLPFEPEWFAAHGCQATYVGHPYFDELQGQLLHLDFIESASRGGKLVAILPGSRDSEVEANLPAFLQAARRIRTSVPTAHFAIAAFSERHAERARQLADAAGLSIPIHVGRTQELICAATCCLATSGSVSLELLYYRTPAVMHYRVNPVVEWLFSRFLMRAKYITLVNLLASAQWNRPCGAYDPHDPRFADAILPEYPTSCDRHESLADHIVEWLEDEGARQAVVRRLTELRAVVCREGASTIAARHVLEQLGASFPPAMDPPLRRAA